ncbi:Ankyrin repeat and SAM domain-containing protein 1A [Araneus ventricosus]|uniref:Ankyrin repeat and SAM domain-containing protein 1A n=2 Tax=Araneus ventricosus TaxID=182803 RepID=A0A4Y2E1W1_ARAVE|nr:Ankyrin repeat and SAM domain-containing protein 1A [Araneus ventricosus]
MESSKRKSKGVTQIKSRFLILRRGPGPNIQDNNGYTPLHHACLNGHKEIVALLLTHEASANIVDHKGCTPLHLAAWSGNTDIVELLLTHGPSFPSVNHMNFDHESALHSAAQYGHTEIVKLLLENKCYPSVRNVRNESPLDLASQYGRLETVECLLNSHPGLLNDIVRCHSPLHLAAKNGHKHVVKLLLDSGFDVNYMTDIGTALHEAAMYGKLEVVKLLLDYGCDPTLENSRKRVVFDILGDLNTSIAKQIEEVIRDHMTLIKLDVGSNESLPSILPPQGFVMGSHLESLLPERCSLSEITPPRQFCSPTFDDGLYDVPPPPKLVNPGSPRVNDSLSSVTPSQSQDSSFDQTSCSSCSPSKCDPQESSAFDNNIYQNVDADNLLYEIPPPPSFFTSKRYSDPLQQCSIYQNVSVCDMNERKDICYDSSAWRLQNSYIPMLPANSCDSRPQPPAKPPRKSLSPHSSETKNVSSQRNSYEFLCLATSGLHDCSPKFLDRNKNNKGSNYAKPYHKTEYVDMSLPNQVIATYENHDIICANGLDVNRISSGSDDKNNSLYSSYTSKFSEVLPFSLFYEDGYRKGSSFNNLMPSKSTPALHASRHTLDQVVPPISKEYPFQKPTNLNIVKNRASVHIPSSPTNYDQPPTPDNPPPSPGTAEIGIHEKIHPARQANQSDFALHDYHLADPQYLHSYQIGASNFSSRCQSFKSSSFQPDVHFEKSNNIEVILKISTSN